MVIKLFNLDYTMLWILGLQLENKIWPNSLILADH